MDDVLVHRLGARLLLSSLALTGMIVVASWIFGQARDQAGLRKPLPESGTVSPERHYQSPPGR